jgi:hypothetical protein
MDEYQELMNRYELMTADWMRRVKDDPTNGCSFYSHGVCLGKRGQLRMRALDTNTGNTLWELTTEPGDTQVRITFPSGDTYLV